MSTDTILILGSGDSKLQVLLNKLGYSVIAPNEQTPLPEALAKTIVDMIVIDSRHELLTSELCQYLRTDNFSKEIPLVCLSDKEEIRKEIEGLKLEKIEFVDLPYSAGKLAGQIATILRLRKISGAKDVNATLSEMNAALRDLNMRFSRELEEAKNIQQSLLPAELPSDDSYEFAVSYAPLEQVGGDWYYLRKESDGCVTVQIADVTGHGLAAAFIGSMTKLALSAAQKLLPDEILTEMNRLMTPQLPEGRFVTMSSYRYDPQNGKIIAARAGHPPPIICKRNPKKVVQLQAKGFPIGFFEEGQYTREEMTLEVNDVAVVITDGISEAQDRNFKAYGFERLSQALLATKEEYSATQILNFINEDFRKFLDGRALKDDVTIIVLKRRR